MTQHALPPEVDRRVELAVIGASAGGIDALFQLLDGLRRPLRGAIVVVLHLPEDHRSRLVEVFSHRIGLPVQEPHAVERVGRGTVYVAPPGYHLLVEADETFALGEVENLMMKNVVVNGKPFAAPAPSASGPKS